ncbi:MAG: hypothetical protein EXR79_07960 [Myxococcales bacterium]|nr:hypothetical protein [Myxococcales bacterium]
MATVRCPVLLGCALVAAGFGACSAQAPGAASGAAVTKPVFKPLADAGTAAPLADAGSATDSAGGDAKGKDAATVPSDGGTAPDLAVADATPDAGAADSVGPQEVASGDGPVASDATPFPEPSPDTGATLDGPEADGAIDSAASCGDKECGPAESCSSCPQDCGKCPEVCGNGSCGAGEDCKACAADCGKCPEACGDGNCGGGETCTTCPADCGKCPTGCGNGKCDQPAENCQGCPADCGACPGACDPLTQSGCDGAQQCYPAPPTQTFCAPFGKLAKGVGCDASDACQKGLLCVGSVCRLLCDYAGKNGGLGCVAPAKCVELSNGTKPLGWNLGACLGGDTCNLLTNLGCPPGQACVSFQTTKLCGKAGIGGTGVVCQGTQDCLATHLCVGGGAAGTCKLRCHAGGGSPKCPLGACGQVTLGQGGPVAGDSLGVCQ